MKFINHQTKNCKVCKICSDEKSVCMNKIIRKVNLPEKVFTGFGCKDCLMNPIVGNLYKCPICPFHLSCEKCEEIGKHEHHLIMTSSKVETILKGSLVSIPSPSPSVKIQIMGGKVCLRCKGKTLLGVVNKILFSIVC